MKYCKLCGVKTDAKVRIEIRFVSICEKCQTFIYTKIKNQQLDLLSLKINLAEVKK